MLAARWRAGLRLVRRHDGGDGRHLDLDVAPGPGAACWSPAERLSDGQDRSEQNPVLHVVSPTEVWLFHTSQPGGRQDLCEIHARVSRDGGQSFGPARRLGDLRGILDRQPVQIGPAFAA